MPEGVHVAEYALDGRTHMVEVDGQIDLYSAPVLKETASRVIDGGAKRIIVDLSSVTFMDSTGLGVLIGVLKRLRNLNGELGLVVTDYDIERVFELSGLDGTFEIYRSRDEAVERLTRTF